MLVNDPSKKNKRGNRNSPPTAGEVECFWSAASWSCGEKKKERMLGSRGEKKNLQTERQVSQQPNTLCACVCVFWKWTLLTGVTLPRMRGGERQTGPLNEVRTCPERQTSAERKSLFEVTSFSTNTKSIWCTNATSITSAGCPSCFLCFHLSKSAQWNVAFIFGATFLYPP